ncbi:L,D-transpeptidase [Streptacidiphilus griseoplanus]|uniref:L,D-transpeptidase n=1 Tax=Peterkaempfera griseoplana TaxID=66896 RepID=UPI000AB373A5|nr:L,D-transpeptidase [Peterkaempfera griseoplana]
MRTPRRRRTALSGVLAALLTAAMGAGAAGLQTAAATSAPSTLGRQSPGQASTGHVTVLDMSTHKLRATANGKTVAVFPVGFGQPRFPTHAGTYRVLGKDSMVRMTSCSAGITCDTSSPDYYSLPVRWAVRLTEAGLFVHAAPWDHTIGTTDISHGCIHLSTANARWFYNFSRVGDTVIVQG